MERQASLQIQQQPFTPTQNFMLSNYQPFQPQYTQTLPHQYY